MREIRSCERDRIAGESDRCVCERQNPAREISPCESDGITSSVPNKAQQTKALAGMLSRQSNTENIFHIAAQ